MPNWVASSKYRLSIPYSSDKTEEIIFKEETSEHFLSHIVQIKLSLLFTNKSLNLLNFLSHIVQIKHDFYNDKEFFNEVVEKLENFVDRHTIIFLSHIVQIKLEIDV